MDLLRNWPVEIDDFDISPSPASGWTAIVLAGERPGGDPLARELHVPMKALIKIDGVTLLDHVLNALLAAREIDRIIVLSQHLELLSHSDPICSAGHEKLELVRSGEGIASSIEAAIETAQAAWPLLVTTADNALLTPDRVRDFVRQSNEHDVTIGVGRRDLVESQFPEMRRTWLKFSDGHYSGANVFALTSRDGLKALQFWSRVERDRKSAFRLLSRFGPALLFRALTRSISFSAAIEKASARLGFRALPIVLDSEAPLDVDKQSDLHMAQTILSARKANAPT